MRQIAPLIVVVAMLVGLGVLMPPVAALPHDDASQATQSASESTPILRAPETAINAVPLATETLAPRASDAPTATPSATPTATPTATRTPTATATPTQLPTAFPLPKPGVRSINGLPFEKIVVMTDATRANMREIYARGRAIGWNPHAFGKVGDSTIEPPLAFNGWDAGNYKLGAYAHLSATLQQFAGSFARASVAVVRGMSSHGAFDETWVKPGLCDAERASDGRALGPLPCEVKLFSPSLMLVRLGSNDDGAAAAFEANMRVVVQYLIDRGIVPIIGTKADRNGDPDNAKNAALRRIAASLEVPLWDLDALTGTLADHGVNTEDRVHLTYYFSYDYTDPTAYVRGHGLQNLSALVALDEVWRVVH